MINQRCRKDFGLLTSCLASFLLLSPGTVFAYGQTSSGKTYVRNQGGTKRRSSGCLVRRVGVTFLPLTSFFFICFILDHGKDGWCWGSGVRCSGWNHYADSNPSYGLTTRAALKTNPESHRELSRKCLSTSARTLIASFCCGSPTWKSTTSPFEICSHLKPSICESTRIVG
jgi:hypothetical protein